MSEVAGSQPRVDDTSVYTTEKLSGYMPNIFKMTQNTWFAFWKTSLNMAINDK